MNNSSRGLFYSEYKRGFGIEKYLVLVSCPKGQVEKYVNVEAWHPVPSSCFNGKFDIGTSEFSPLLSN
jgi:hypothetical protein